MGTVTFELEDLNFADDVAAGNIVVGFRATDTAEAIGRELVAQINGAGLSARATMLGGTGNIDLGCNPNFLLTLPFGSPVLRTGPWALQAPVAGAASILDGDQFTITDVATGVVTTFEFENSVTNNGVHARGRSRSATCPPIPRRPWRTACGRPWRRCRA